MQPHSIVPLRCSLMHPAEPRVLCRPHHAHSQGPAFTSLLHMQPGPSVIVQVQQHLQVSSSQETILARLADNEETMTLSMTHAHAHSYFSGRVNLSIHQTQKSKREKERRREGGGRKEGTGKMSREGLVGEPCLWIRGLARRGRRVLHAHTAIPHACRPLLGLPEGQTPL